MTGEHHLAKLLKSIQPVLYPEEYVFCCVSEKLMKCLNVSAIAQFRESEGITLIINKQEAENANLEYQYISKMITLSIHSSLNAIGFLAVVTTKFTEHGISVNVVSAYYHDHLFVAVENADRALKLLLEMSHSADNE
ncbi:ACT domain-containing protein [Phormidesmis sp. 146-35]